MLEEITRWYYVVISLDKIVNVWYLFHSTNEVNKTASFQKEAMRTQVALYFFYEVKFV